MKSMNPIVVPVLFLMVALAGCGKKTSETLAEKLMESAASAGGEEVDIEFDPDSGSMRIKTADGEVEYRADAQTGSLEIETDRGALSLTTGENVRIPDDFPKDVPVYPGFKPRAVSAMGQAGSYSMSGPVSATADAVAAHYKKEAAAQGWKEVMAMSRPQATMLSYQKGDRTFQVTLTPSDGTVMLSLMTMQKR